MANKALRQAINAPIQSTLTDMMIWAIALIEAELGSSDVQVVCQIHDALIAYVPTNKVMELTPQITQIMASLPFHEFGWSPQLSFPADAEAGPNMADLKKMKW